MGSLTLQARPLGALGGLLLIGGATLLILASCSPPADCPDRLRCPGADAGAGGAGHHPSSTGAGADSGAGGGVDGGAVDLCAPTDQGNVVPTSCGIFVRVEGDDKNPGTRDLPVATLTKAVSLAVGKGYIYACDQTFTENLVLTTGLRLYGGLDCNAEWLYLGPGGNPTILAPPAGVPLILKSGADGVRLSGFQIIAPDGGAPDGSSIAVLATGAKGVIVRSQLIAGAGVSGADGGDASPNAAAPAQNGAAGGAVCSASSVAGGVGPSNECGTSYGGTGGVGGISAGGVGAAGGPSSGGVGGVGDPGGTWTCDSKGGEGFGHKGADGGKGNSGQGGTALGKLAEDGYHGADGGQGSPGIPGRGGGGGGGRAGSQCSVPGRAGGGGGSGAPGGCGGKGGGGGTAGGSSFALVSVASSLTLTDVTLTAGNGGRGGRGGLSQPGAEGGKGGPGGSGAPASLIGCSGGDGGRGGDGAPGGGGRGGHSIGVAYTGSAPVLKGGSITFGVVGAGGPSSNNNAGAEGVAMEVQGFD